MTAFRTLLRAFWEFPEKRLGVFLWVALSDASVRNAHLFEAAGRVLALRFTYVGRFDEANLEMLKNAQQERKWGVPKGAWM